MKLFIQLIWFFRQHWQRYLVTICLLMMIVLLQLLPPKIVEIVVDGVDSGQMDHSTLLKWVGLMAMTALLIYISRYCWRIALFGASYQLAIKLCANFYYQFSRQHPDFYLRYRTGDLIARVTNDVDRVVFAAGEGILTMVDSLLMGSAVLIVMSTQISWQLTLLALLPMLVMAMLIKGYGGQLHHRFRLAQEAFSALTSQAQDSLTNIRMIKALGLEKHQSAIFSQKAQQAGEQKRQVARVDARFDPTIYLTISAANLLAVAGGGWMVIKGQ